MSISTPHNNSHAELEDHIRAFQSELGNDWDKYQETLSLFLIGKLSRTEMVNMITPILERHSGGVEQGSPRNLIAYHNKLLLLNFANSFKEGPVDPSNDIASFWNKKNAATSKPKNVKSSQYEKFKQNIMGLPIRERRRIKNITRDSGRRGKLNASITLTRHSLLPRIPMIQDKQQQQSHVNNLVSWQQDVVNGINTPIATDNYEIPDHDNLSRRMVMTMREYGLTGALNQQVMEVLLLGLDVHLKNIIESAIDVARYRETKYASNVYLGAMTTSSLEPIAPSAPSVAAGSATSGTSQIGEDSTNGSVIKDSNDPESWMTSSISNTGVITNREDEISPDRKRQKITLHTEDLFDTLELYPHLIEPSGPRLRLANVMLQNDDMVTHGELDYELPPKHTMQTSTVDAPAEKSTPENETDDMSSDVAHDKTSKGEKLETDSKIAKDNPDEAEKPKTDDKNMAVADPARHPVRFESHIGTHDELKWLIHDLISTM